MRFSHSILCIFISVVSAIPVKAQQRIDTTRVYRLQGVEIKENRKMKELRSTTPLQVLNINHLKQSGAIMVSDAAKMFSGVTVKDYGGIGGLKTISVRGLGANHTSVVYDGVAITDAQTGQIDLGKLSLDNVDFISLSNGQNDNIFQSARLFASAGILNIQSHSPLFSNNKRFQAQASFKTGSFGFINPNFRVSQKWNKTFTSTVHADYLKTDGAYPYTLYNGVSTEKRKRKNSDIESIKTEANLFARIDEHQNARLKAYYYQSRRGLPTNILYNEYAGQRLWDKNTFIQGTYENRFNEQWSFLANGKFNWSYNRYNDPSTHNEKGETDNHYYQNESYLSATILYRLSPHLSFSLANDGSINHMNADLDNFAHPTRYTLLNVLAAKYITERFTVAGHLLSTLTKEKAEYGTAASNRQRLSPFISFSFQPFREEDLRIRFFYKDIFRLPTFNDLYYGSIGTRNLKPEKAAELNAGVSWLKKINHFIPLLSVSIDGYYNRITDKIVAMPGKNLFIWSMMNVGRVDIKGVDVNLETIFSPFKEFNITLTGNYTCQRALDKTDKYNLPDMITYNHQIPYTPRHSGSARIGVETPWINFSYTLMASGERFCNQYNSPEYRLDGYREHSFTMFRTFHIKSCRLTAQFEILNFTNEQYEIVKNYPMPGRQYRGSILFNY